MNVAQKDFVAAYGTGPVRVQELQTSLPRAWDKAISDATTREKIAKQFNIDPARLNGLAAPFKLKRGSDEGFDHVTIAIVVSWIAHDLLEECFKDMAKDEIKKRIEQVWSFVKSYITDDLEKRDAFGDRAKNADLS